MTVTLQKGRARLWVGVLHGLCACAAQATQKHSDTWWGGAMRPPIGRVGRVPNKLATLFDPIWRSGALLAAPRGIQTTAVKGARYV